jgi:inosose dehydratase
MEEFEMSNIKWSYMDHWLTGSPKGLTSPYISVDYMDRYIKQLASLGFTGFDTFGFRLGQFSELFGSVKKFERFIQDRGMEKLTGVFSAMPNVTKARAPHVRSTHDVIFRDMEQVAHAVDGLTGVENFVVMPSSTYFEVEPVTDEKIKVMADLWNRVGKMTQEHGMKLTCHLEFWGAIRTEEQIDKFFRWTDPAYVYYFCDGAQHVIAGVDPLNLYLKLHDRCSGIHLKDTHNVDLNGEYRLPPDPEIIAKSVKRWFWEVGTPEGLVDYPVLMKALKEYNYSGWICVEHDKADVEGGNFAESTCISKWYIDNVLAKIFED